MVYKDKDVFVSTIIAFDTGRWETAVSHPKYHHNQLIIVAEYGSDSVAAKQGHEHWIKVMTSDPLPECIIEVPSCMLKVLLDLMAGDNEQNIHVRED